MMHRTDLYAALLLEVGPEPDDIIDYSEWHDATEAALNRYSNVLERDDLDIHGFIDWLDEQKESE